MTSRAMTICTSWSRRRGMPRIGAVLAAAVLLLSIPAASAVSDPSRAASKSGDQSPRGKASSVVEQTVEEVIAILRNSELSSEQRLTLIEQIVYGRFDLATMSRYVLARDWRRFSKEQQTEYVAAFKQYLSKNYGGRLGRYDQFDVDVTVVAQVIGNGCFIVFDRRTGLVDQRAVDAECNVLFAQLNAGASAG